MVIKNSLLCFNHELYHYRYRWSHILKQCNILESPQVKWHLIFVYGKLWISTTTISCDLPSNRQGTTSNHEGIPITDPHQRRHTNRATRRHQQPPTTKVKPEESLQQLEAKSIDAAKTDDNFIGAEHVINQQPTNSDEADNQQPMRNGIPNLIPPSKKDCAPAPGENLEPNSTGLNKASPPRLCTKSPLQSLSWPLDQGRRKRNSKAQRFNSALAIQKPVLISVNELVLSEMGENLFLWPFSFPSSLVTRQWDPPSPILDM